jgi:hypothetical protein
MSIRVRLDDLEDNQLNPLLDSLRPYAPKNERGTVNVFYSIKANLTYQFPTESEPYIILLTVDYLIDSMREVEYHFDIPYELGSEPEILHLEVFYDNYNFPTNWAIRDPPSGFTYEVGLADKTILGLAITGDATWLHDGQSVAILSTGLQLLSVAEVPGQVVQLSERLDSIENLILKPYKPRNVVGSINVEPYIEMQLDIWDAWTNQLHIKYTFPYLVANLTNVRYEYQIPYQSQSQSGRASLQILNNLGDWVCQSDELTLMSLSVIDDFIELVVDPLQLPEFVFGPSSDFRMFIRICIFNRVITRLGSRCLRIIAESTAR